MFQFESDGMRKHLKDLKPSRFEDLIAMVALYRPGPMAYIPNFIKRKHGQEEIKYDFPEINYNEQNIRARKIFVEYMIKLSKISLKGKI